MHIWGHFCARNLSSGAFRARFGYFLCSGGHISHTRAHLGAFLCPKPLAWCILCMFWALFVLRRSHFSHSCTFGGIYVPEKILLCESEHALSTFYAPDNCTSSLNPFLGTKCPSQVHCFGCQICIMRPPTAFCLHRSAYCDRPIIPCHFLQKYPYISTELQELRAGNRASGICNGRNKWGQVNPGTA